MAISTVYTYPLNGSVVEFNVPFEYLARKFVTVTLIGAAGRRVLVLNTDYRFATKTKVQTFAAWGPADGYATIEIRRETSVTERLVSFTDGSVLRANEMNLSQIQTLHVAEEARNLAADTIAENDDGDLDARGRKIVNLQSATEPDHAVTLAQVQEWSGSALNQANRAKTEADRAEANAYVAVQHAQYAGASASSASSSQAAALSSENKAKASETAAKTSETNAKASETASKTSETNAKASETASKTSETNAKASETAAAGYAAGLNMPSAAGNGSKLLRQRTDETGLEYVMPGSAAYRNVMTGPFDGGTAGGLMFRGACGFGASYSDGGLPLASNLAGGAEAYMLGFSLYTIDTQGRPGAGSGYGAALNIPVINQGVYGNYGVQVYFDYAVDSISFRRLVGTQGWSPERSLYHTGNVNGTVSQSGGVPTGALSERIPFGTDGYLIKRADGSFEGVYPTIWAAQALNTGRSLQIALPFAASAVTVSAAPQYSLGDGGQSGVGALNSNGIYVIPINPSTFGVSSYAYFHPVLEDVVVHIRITGLWY